MNNVELSGKIYKPKLRFTPNGAAVWEASIGISRKKGDEWQTEFFDLIAFGKTAEDLAEVLTDKTPVSRIRGALRQERWEKEGVKHQRVRVVVFEAEKKGTPKVEDAPVDPEDEVPF